MSQISSNVGSWSHFAGHAISQYSVTKEIDSAMFHFFVANFCSLFLSTTLLEFKLLSVFFSHENHLLLTRHYPLWWKRWRTLPSFKIHSPFLPPVVYWMKPKMSLLPCSLILPHVFDSQPFPLSSTPFFLRLPLVKKIFVFLLRFGLKETVMGEVARFRSWWFGPGFMGKPISNEWGSRLPVSCCERG